MRESNRGDDSWTLFQSLVKRLINAFNSIEIDYMFKGAIASSYYGVPRTTMAVDIIVTVSEMDYDILVFALSEIHLNVSIHDFPNALESGYKIMSVDDQLTPFTVDFILLDSYLEKIPFTLFDEHILLQRPENLVRAKLRMIKSTTLEREKSAKDRADLRAII